MKTLMLQVVFVLFIVFASCQKEPIIRFGFETEFGKDSKGLSMMNVVSSAKSITLTGEILLEEGAVLMQLINPEGEEVFTRERFMPGNLRINEFFPATEGIWKLKYQSIEGKGSIRVHVITDN